jgi:hypothetical protein
MKKLPLLCLILLTPLFILGCSTGSLDSPVVEAADPGIGQRPTVAPIQQILPSDSLPPDYCPVTQPPEKAFSPPAPYRQEPYPGHFFYGTEALWTSIPLNPVWYGLPYTEGSGFTQKLFYQRDGYNWRDDPTPALIVNGRKIDPNSKEEQTLVTSAATNAYTPDDGSFMLVGADSPSTGCWQITGRYGSDELTYTIWVAP